MLTEADIERIMAAKWQLPESALDDGDYELIDDIEIVEPQEEDTPITETNGLI
jgi:hypothetical protein